MKTLLAVILFSIVAQAQTFVGDDYNGNKCTLIVDKISYADGIEDFQHIQVSVRTSWQLEINPAIETKASPTPWTLHGKNKENYDSISISLEYNGTNPLKPYSFVFQTWDEDRGLVQKACRLY